MAPTEVVEGIAPPVIGVGIGIAFDGTVYEAGGNTGLIATPETGKPAGEGGAAAEEPVEKKKKPMLQVKSDKGDDGGKS